MRRIRNRAVLGRVPHSEIEEVDDADARRCPVMPASCHAAGVGQLHLVADDRPGAECLVVRHAVDSQRVVARN